MVDEKTTTRFFLTERLYLNADKSKVLKEGEPGAAFLFGGEGAEVSAEDVEKYDLKKSTTNVVPAGAVGSEPEGEVKDEEKPEEEAEDLESKSKAELIEIAEGKGVEVKSAMTKADLIEAIEGAEE